MSLVTKNNQSVRGVEDNSSPVIKGGYYIAPSGPAPPKVNNLEWGTALPSLASGSTEEQKNDVSSADQNKLIYPPAQE